MRILYDLCDRAWNSLLKCSCYFLEKFFDLYLSFVDVDQNVNVYAICYWNKISCCRHDISRWILMILSTELIVLLKYFRSVQFLESLDQISCFECSLTSWLLKISEFFRSVQFLKSLNQILCFERSLIRSWLRNSRFLRKICFRNNRHHYNMRNVRRIIDRYRRVTRLLQSQYYSSRNERLKFVLIIDARWLLSFLIKDEFDLLSIWLLLRFFLKILRRWRHESL